MNIEALVAEIRREDGGPIGYVRGTRRKVWHIVTALRPNEGAWTLCNAKAPMFCTFVFRQNSPPEGTLCARCLAALPTQQSEEKE